MPILQSNDQQQIRILPVADVVAFALTEPIVSFGQLSPEQKKELEKAVSQGILKKGMGGGFPAAKTVYANPSYDIEGEHQKEIDELKQMGTRQEVPVDIKNGGNMLKAQRAFTEKELSEMTLQAALDAKLQRAKPTPLSYDVYELDGTFETTVTVQHPGSQEVVNAIVELGLDPVRYTWKPSDGSHRAQAEVARSVQLATGKERSSTSTTDATSALSKLDEATSLVQSQKDKGQEFGEYGLSELDLIRRALSGIGDAKRALQNLVG